MKEPLVFIGLAVIAYAFRLLCIKVYEDSYKNTKETTGTIRSIHQSDGGSIHYYIDFTTDDGERVRGDSVHYSKTNGRYRVGDTVMFKYILIRKGRASVSIIDENLVPVSESMVVAIRNLGISTLLFLFISCLFYLRITVFKLEGNLNGTLAMLILAVTFYFMRLIFKFLAKDKLRDAMKTTGIINDIIENGRGKTWFYVNLNDNNDLYKSIPYDAVRRDFKIGDRVTVKHCRSYKKVEIVHKALVPTREYYRKATRNIGITSIVCVVLSTLYAFVNMAN